MSTLNHRLPCKSCGKDGVVIDQDLVDRKNATNVQQSTNCALCGHSNAISGMFCRPCGKYHHLMPSWLMGQRWRDKPTLPPSIPCVGCGNKGSEAFARYLRGRMMISERFAERWEPLFGNEAWFPPLIDVRETLTDWDGPHGKSLDAVLYQLARARGLSSRYTCASCGRVSADDDVDSYECGACVREDAELNAENARRSDEARAKREAWYNSLTPEQRDLEYAKAARMFLSGLITRDVQ